MTDALIAETITITAGNGDTIEAYSARPLDEAPRGGVEQRRQAKHQQRQRVPPRPRERRPRRAISRSRRAIRAHRPAILLLSATY